MGFEFYIVFILIGFLIFFNLKRTIQRIDQNIEYNDSRPDFVHPMVWMKKVYNLRSEKIPKYVYVRSFSIVFALLGIINSIIYFCTYHNENIAKILALIQICYYLLDLTCFFLYIAFYNARRRQRKTE